ncbi:MAG: phosphatase PAP2 family protein [Bacteroidota bacterium]|nr:phosphatase PAP2 family protein [Bacteroidota bacterium]
MLIYFQIQYNQIQISLWVNSLHSNFLDITSKYGTYAGDGLFSVFISLLLFRFNKKLAVCIMLSYLISAGFTQLLKHLIFHELTRPILHLDAGTLKSIHFVDGVELNYQNSFPSGHATSAFALLSTFVLFMKSDYLKVFFLFLASYIAFTRVYLLQHFLIDVFTGSLIGTLTAFLVYYFLIRKNVYSRLKIPFNDKNS